MKIGLSTNWVRGTVRIETFDVEAKPPTAEVTLQVVSEALLASVRAGKADQSEANVRLHDFTKRLEDLLDAAGVDRFATYHLT